MWSIGLNIMMFYIKKSFYCLSLFTFIFLLACQSNFPTSAQQDPAGIFSSQTIAKPKVSDIKSLKIQAVLKSANEQISITTSYTQKYYSISYPNGDVPKYTGACTDVVIRSLRSAGLDLQKEVHEDMKANFSKYPKIWGLRKTDTNIDHRRVPNLKTFFSRKGKSLSIRQVGSDYKPGDIVSWDLNGKGLTHIGLVSNMWNTKEKRYLIIHNIGSGAELEDRLFEWEITGHYRYW